MAKKVDKPGAPSSEDLMAKIQSIRAAQGLPVTATSPAEAEEEPDDPFGIPAEEPEPEGDREERFPTTCTVHGNIPTTGIRFWEGGKVVRTEFEPCAECLNPTPEEPETTTFQALCPDCGEQPVTGKSQKIAGKWVKSTPRCTGCESRAAAGAGTVSKAGGMDQLGKPVSGPCPQCGRNKVEGIIGTSGKPILPRCADCVQAEERMKSASEDAGQAERRLKRKQAAQENILSYVSQIGVDDERHFACSFGSFNDRYDRDALKASMEFAESFSKGQRPDLYLYSKRDGELISPGNGKTHLAIACARAAMTEGILDPADIRFVRETRMAITLRRLIREGDPETYLDSLIRAPLLIIDDVGKAKLDGGWLRELYFELNAARESRSTIRTGNYSPDELILRDEDLWAPIMSRAVGKGDVAMLSGPDQRPNIQKGGAK